MERNAAGQARVVPIILRPVDWQDAPFNKLTALPKDAKPITAWNNRDQAFLDVSNGIRQILEGVNQLDASEQPSVKPADFIVHRYQGSILQVGGIGSHLVTKRAWLTSEHAYLPPDDYVTHFFNGAGDVLWAHCPEEFEVVGATSATNNDVFQMVNNDPAFPWGIVLRNQLQNSITITCQRIVDEVERGRATGTVCPNCGDAMGPYQKSCAKCGYTFKG